MDLKEIFKEYDQEEVREYLNELRDSGAINMFGAGPYLEREFGMNRREYREVVMQYMKDGLEGEYA